MSDFNDDNNKMDRNVVKLRGLPWDSTPADILDFLKDCVVVNGEKGVHMAISHRDGRPNGEAYVELETPEDVDRAFSYNKNVLGHRYIEIFNAKPEEFDQCLKRQNVMQQDTFIKLRGLPFSCKLEEIEQFFEGLEIRNGKTGIYIVYDSHGRMTGECFVQFRTSDDAENALKRNREKIGHRYIEIFRSSASECRRSTMLFNRGGGGGGMNSGGFGNDRMMNRGGGPGPRNNRNFRDRPYPDNNWSDGPWRNNNRGGNNGGGNNNFGNDSFGGNNMFSSDNYDRKWNQNSNDRGNGGGNNFGNSFGSGGSGGSGFNSFSNNRDNNFGNDRGFNGNNNMGGNNMNNGGRFLVHLRGMPYDCNEMEVHQFFAPLKVVDCEIIYDDRGRHSGEADAYFLNVEDAQEAMKKHKEKMGSRYIELFASRNSGRGRF
ncbi:heterogeneous nuclear ribonucleoprotein H2 [Chironomus tepperi]|uniref:heterogeneous nuclear ribonucleoprotein H2 n=1 Tax=Chironomus tepperi TaxID=113505 RepID=UPI00391F8CC8